MAISINLKLNDDQDAILTRVAAAQDRSKRQQFLHSAMRNLIDLDSRPPPHAGVLRKNQPRPKRRAK